MNEMMNGRDVDTARSLAREGGKTQKILIVEDNELNMKLFRDLLEAHGYERTSRATGRKPCRCADR